MQSPNWLWLIWKYSPSIVHCLSFTEKFALINPFLSRPKIKYPGNHYRKTVGRWILRNMCDISGTRANLSVKLWQWTIEGEYFQISQSQLGLCISPFNLIRVGFHFWLPYAMHFSVVFNYFFLYLSYRCCHGVCVPWTFSPVISARWRFDWSIAQGSGSQGGICLAPLCEDSSKWACYAWHCILLAVRLKPFTAMFLSKLNIKIIHKHELCSATTQTTPLESTHRELSFEWSHL